MTAEELGLVGEMLLNANTPAEEAALTEEFVAGFYGKPVTGATGA